MTVVASKYAPIANDLYETEPYGTEALLRFLPMVRPRMSVWEPAAGNHRIADVLAARGAFVITSDVATYSRPHTFQMDFLGADPAWPVLTDALITNPPYGPQNRTAAKFARLALRRCPGWVALLLTANFDSGKTRRDLFADNPRFAFKVVLVDRLVFFEGDFEGTSDHAWFVWEPANYHLHASPRLFYAGRDQ
ncbi:hypothetical protein [Bradyrhizobium ivorense]|uniref:hypothetical protein n=1 Tax=Bradyrhizobium ivorense TaxID=2511166 RepID=UPI0010B93338|nr:hypothetical protein [Bradyrhizobium ivorense]VIO73864.1 hypothetical protein CI41S_39730 [Bradyrhizobium ivorense]